MATVWKIIQWDDQFDPPRIYKVRFGDTEQGFRRSLQAVRSQERSYKFKAYQSEVRVWQPINLSKW